MPSSAIRSRGPLTDAAVPAKSIWPPASRCMPISPRVEPASDRSPAASRRTLSDASACPAAPRRRLRPASILNDPPALSLPSTRVSRFARAWTSAVDTNAPANARSRPAVARTCLPCSLPAEPCARSLPLVRLMAASVRTAPLKDASWPARSVTLPADCNCVPASRATLPSAWASSVPDAYTCCGSTRSRPAFSVTPSFADTTPATRDTPPRESAGASDGLPNCASACAAAPAALSVVTPWAGCGGAVWVATVRLRADCTRASCSDVSRLPDSEMSLPAATRKAPCVRRLPCAPTVASPPASMSNAAPAPTAPGTATLRAAVSATAPAACATPCTARSPPLSTRRSPAACTVARGAMRTSPAALTCKSPVSAIRLPPMFTPTPASVPIRRMLSAYMPPSAAVSSVTPGAGPSPACADTAPVP